MEPLEDQVFQYLDITSIILGTNWLPSDIVSAWQSLFQRSQY